MNLHEARSYYMPKWRDVNTFLRKWLVWNASEGQNGITENVLWNASRLSSSLALVNWGQQVSCQKQTKAPWEIQEILNCHDLTLQCGCICFCLMYFAICAVILFAVRGKFLTRSHTVWLNYCQTRSEKRSEAVQVSTLSYHFCSWFLANYLQFQDFFNEHLYSMLCHVLCHVMPLNRSLMIQASWAWKLGLGLALAHICAKHHRLRSCRGSQTLCPRSAATMWQQNRKVQMNMAELLGINLIAIFWEILRAWNKLRKALMRMARTGGSAYHGILIVTEFFSWGLICHAQGPWIRYVASRRIQRTGRHKCLRLDISSAKPCKTWQESQRVQRTREALRQLGAKKDLLNLDSYLLDRRWNQIANQMELMVS